MDIITNIALRQAFHAWYLKNNGDLFATDATEFYGKTDIEQRGYLLKFLESRNLLVLLQVNDKMFNKFYIELYDKAKGERLALPKNCKTPDEAFLYGIEKAFEKLAANGN